MISVSIGKGGWVLWGLSEPLMSGYVRFAPVGSRMKVVELYLDEVPAQADLSRVPIRALEAWANDVEGEGVESLRSQLTLPGVQLKVAASYYHTYTTTRAPQTWVRDMLVSQLPDSGVEPVPASPRRPLEVIDGEVDPVVDVPDARPYGDDFYERVARVYAPLAARYRNPNARIADANGVSLKAVEGWVRRARDRGFLPPAEHGMRG